MPDLPRGFARTAVVQLGGALSDEQAAIWIADACDAERPAAARAVALDRLADAGILPPIGWRAPEAPVTTSAPPPAPPPCARHRYDGDACKLCGAARQRKRKAGAAGTAEGIATAGLETRTRLEDTAPAPAPSTDPLAPPGPAAPQIHAAAALATGPAPTGPALPDATPASSGSVGDPLDELRLDWLDREERLPRATYIGSADIAMLLGCSPHGGPMDVWLAKTQPREERDEQWLRMGHRLQPAIAAEAAHVLGLRLDASEVQIRHPEGVCACSLDYLAASGPGEPDTILEVKATGMWGPWRDLDEDEIPQSVLAQVQYQAAIARAAGYPIRRAFVARLLGLEVRTYEVAIDDQLGAALLEEARRFWRAHIETRTPPPADGSEAWGRWARRIRQRTPLRAATDEERYLVEEWRAIRAARLEHEDREEELTQELLTVIGDAGGLEGLVAVQTRAGSPRWRDIAHAVAERAGVDIPDALVQEHTGAGSCSLREVKVKKERKAS